jgi:hypothetical protein
LQAAPMPTVFEKLNLKSQSEILVLDAPESFEGEFAGLAGVRVLRKLAAAKDVGFALAFVTRQADLDRLSEQLVRKAVGDALLWIAYPKGTSKRYTCDFNRDTGFATLRRLGFDSVRQIAIDEDWSALRFRRNEHIKAK